MGHPISKDGRATKSGHFVLTSARGEKISAVEGMTLSARMREILKQSAMRGLSGDERRKLVRDEIRKK